MTTAAQVLSRIEAGDLMHMQIVNGKCIWWFEAPHQSVPVQIVAALLADPDSPLREAGDSLFGLPLNSQTYASADMVADVRGDTTIIGMDFGGQDDQTVISFDGVGIDTTTDLIRRLLALRSCTDMAAIDEASTPASLGLDSLDLIYAIIDIEDALGIEITGIDDIPISITVTELATHIDAIKDQAHV